MLGLKAFVLAHPYDVPKWLPDLLLLLVRASLQPAPIKNSVRCASRPESGNATSNSTKPIKDCCVLQPRCVMTSCWLAAHCTEMMHMGSSVWPARQLTVVRRFLWAICGACSPVLQHSKGLPNRALQTCSSQAARWPLKGHSSPRAGDASIHCAGPAGKRLASSGALTRRLRWQRLGRR